MSWEVYLTVGLAVLFLSIGFGVDNQLFRRLSLLYSTAFLLLSASKYVEGQAIFVNKVMNVFGYVLWLIIFYINYRLVVLERKEENSKYIDPLTGAKNRAYFEEVLKEKAANFERLNIRYVVFFLDMDNLKYINDNFGHDVGDKALSELAKAMKDSIRKDKDILVRLGGDEFVLVSPVGACADALIIVNRIENTLMVSSKELPFPISVSVGFACFPDDGKDFHELLKIADKRMYEIKYSRKSGNVSGIR